MSAPAKFKVGDIVRYGAGSTALMEIESVTMGVGCWRYYGTQYFGGRVGAYEYDCGVAMPKEAEAWPGRWACHADGRVVMGGAS